jgi:DNA polymerase-3 subunit beta
MKLTVLQENLNKNISLASRFTSSRAQLPILGNILLKATKTKLSISATNLEVSVSTSIGAKVEKEGEIAIPSKVLAELTGNLPKENIDLEVEKEQLKVTAPGFTSTLLGMNSSDFPKIPSGVNKDKVINIGTDIFSKALEKVIFAVSLDETRPILTGVLFKFLSDGIEIVSTDGFRLSQSKIPNVKSKSSHSVVIPRSILSEIGRNSENKDLSFEFREKEKQVIFEVGETTLSSRLLEGDFPDYEKIIPKTSSHKVTVDKEDFLRAVKLASIFARDNANIVKIKLMKESIKISAESSAAGNQETKVDAKIESGSRGQGAGEFEIAFNYKFLEDFISSVGGESVVMEFSEVDKPGVFLDPSSPDYLHLIMPVKIQS